MNNQDKLMVIRQRINLVASLPVYRRLTEAPAEVQKIVEGLLDVVERVDALVRGVDGVVCDHAARIASLESVINVMVRGCADGE